MEEIWKSVKGFEGFYSVSNTGRLKSHERIVTGKRNFTFPGRIIKPYDRKGTWYCAVSLYKDKK